MGVDHPDPHMVVLAGGGEAVGLGAKRAQVARRRAGFFDRHGLEVARRDGLAVVPPDFQRAESHADACSSGR